MKTVAEMMMDQEPTRGEAFRRDLAKLLNRYSMENGSNTPDHQLADYLIGCLRGLDAAIRERDNWYGYRQFINVTVTAGADGALKIESGRPAAGLPGEQK